MGGYQYKYARSACRAARRYTRAGGNLRGRSTTPMIEAIAARPEDRAVGFDFEHGRLDVSLHPFCGGVPDDVRITTRYNEDDFMSAVMGVLHETGHAMYARGLPPAWRLQPVGEARGMAMHESQSLMIEMQACRSREFVSFLAPLARGAFGGSGPAAARRGAGRTLRRRPARDWRARRRARP